MASATKSPPFLKVGTSVSARFEGAFCESTVRQVDLLLKIKVALKEHPFTSVMVTNKELPADSKYEIGEMTMCLYEGQKLKCQILTVKDQSRYHVVFNDGDRNSVRRSQIVKYGGKHYDTNLMSMPLTNPEAFLAPVKKRRGGPKDANTPSTSRQAADEDSDQQPRPSPILPSKGKRKAAENAMSAIGDIQGVINDTQSDEDEAPSTSSASKRRRRVSTEDSEVPKEEDVTEEDVPMEEGGANGFDADGSQKLSKREQKRLEKMAEKEEKQRLKEEEKEKKARKKEEEKERKRLEKVKMAERRKLEKRYKERLLKLLEKEKKHLKRFLYRRSIGYSLSNPHLRKFKPKKPSEASSEDVARSRGERTPSPTPSEYEPYPEKPKIHYQKHRQLNNYLFRKWRHVGCTIEVHNNCRHKRQWWRLTQDDVFNLVRNYKLTRNRQRRSKIRQWLSGVERDKYAHFVLVHENCAQARRLIKFVERDADGKLTFDERCELDYDEVESNTLRNHFKNQEWYTAVLFPQIYDDENGSACKQRQIRNMATGELYRVWEDDLIPFYWLPEYTITEKKEIIASRPVERQKDFRLGWRLTGDYMQERLHIRSLVAMLKIRHRDCQPIPTLPQTVRFTSDPSPTKRNEPIDDDEEPMEDSENDDNDSDYDSDAYIKKAPTELKDTFIGRLLQFHDSRNTTIPENIAIQGKEIDLYYMYELATRIGSFRKVYSANPWSEWSKKLVPGVRNVEEELKEIYATCLEAYHQFNAKLNYPIETIQVRNERKQVQPGQYSESRKKRAKALGLGTSGPPNGPSPTVNPIQATPKGRVGRKRKGTPESILKRESRNNTLSPGPSEGTVDTAHTDADESEDLDADRTKRKKSRTPARRSVSAKDEFSGVVQPTPKKGRPRKYPAAVTVPTPSESKQQKKADIDGFMRANVLSDIRQNNQVLACHSKDGQWYSGQQVFANENAHTDEILEIMLGLQRNHVTFMDGEPVEQLNRIWSSKRMKVHYAGWNHRHDEIMSYEKVMVRMDDQKVARKRFRSRPNGHLLRPETMAMVETYYCRNEQQPQLDYRVLAREALGDVPFVDDLAEPSHDQENFVDDVVVRRSRSPRISEEERGGTPSSRSSTSVLTTPESLKSESSTSVQSTPKKETPGSSESSTSVVRRSMDSEDEEKEEEKEEEEDVKQEEEEVQKKEERRTPSMSPELGEKYPRSTSSSSSSSTTSNKNYRYLSRSNSPAPPQADALEDVPEAAPKDVPRSPSPPPREKSPESMPTLDSAPSAPASSSVEDRKEEEEEDASKITIRELESDSDEPEYPAVPKSPEPLMDAPPTLQPHQPPLEHFSSPPSSSNYPTLTRQGSSTTSSGPLFPPLAHSGPLTLAEVPPVGSTLSGPLETTEDDVESMKRRRQSTGPFEEHPTTKRSRRISERAAAGTDESPPPPPQATVMKRPPPFTSQFSSGALTLEMTRESSGPIEPNTVARSGRRKTASPTLSNTLNSSGPLTLHSPLGPPPSTTSTVPSATITPGGKVRPPGAPPLGRPKKASSTGLIPLPSVARKEEDEKAAEKTPEVVEAPKVDVTPSPEDKEDVMNDVVPKESPIPRAGQTAGRGGKRGKRGGRFGGVSRAPQPVKQATRKTDDEPEVEEPKEEEEPEAPPTPVIVPPTPPTNTRPDSFANQKARMAKMMEEQGIHKDFSLIKDFIDHVKQLEESPPEDINMNLEELANEARDLFYSAKSELLMLEKSFKKSENARRKNEAAASNPSPPEDPSLSSSNGQSSSGSS